MTRIGVAGWGAVSPAGWGVPALRVALDRGEPLPAQPMPRPTGLPFEVRNVPPPATRPAFLAHPRLRRSSIIGHAAAAATLEALDRAGLTSPGGETRLGLVVCRLAGCTQYTERCYREVLSDPATASPLIFPGTVFNAPASHLAVLLGGVAAGSTLLGDPASFLTGVAMATDWLSARRVDACIVLGAEEPHWLLADALRHFDPQAVLSGGAGALCLTRLEESHAAVELECITDAFLYGLQFARSSAAIAVRQALPASVVDEVLCDGLCGGWRPDKPERAAWEDWPGPRVSPKQTLGEGLMAAAAWQCVVACDRVAAGRNPAARVCLVGINEQAVGARFLRTVPQ
jgi:hypothetical protein